MCFQIRSNKGFLALSNVDQKNNVWLYFFFIFILVQDLQYKNITGVGIETIPKANIRSK